MKRKVNWDNVHKNIYESRAFWDIHWEEAARSLLKSSKEIEHKVIELWDNYSANHKDKSVELKPDYYQGPYFLLLAFAVENMFKAVIVRENAFEFKKHFKETSKFPKELQIHDLLILAEKAGLKYNTEEEDLLRRLTRNAIWAGRYPVPLNYQKSAPGEKFNDGKEYSVSWFGSNDVARLNEFILKVADELHIKIS